MSPIARADIASQQGSPRRQPSAKAWSTSAAARSGSSWRSAASARSASGQGWNATHPLDSTSASAASSISAASASSPRSRCARPRTERANASRRASPRLLRGGDGAAQQVDRGLVVRAVRQRHAAVGEHGGALGPVGGELAGPLQPAPGRRRAAGLQLDEPELAADHARDAVVPAALRERQRLVQHRRALLVAAADGVDERGAERRQRLREQRRVADAARLRARLAQARDARLDGAGVERRAARLELPDGRGAVAAAGRGAGPPRRPRGAPAGRARGPARAGTGPRTRRRARAPRRPRPARDRQRTSSSWALSSNASSASAREASAAASSGAPAASRPSAASRSTLSHMPASAPALDEQPRLEDRARRPDHALQQLAAGERRVGLPGDEREHVDRGPRRQPERQRVSAQHVGAAERAAQLRERPAQRAERVVGVGEDQLRQLRAPDAAARPAAGTPARPRTCGRAAGRRRPRRARSPAVPAGG